MVKKQIITVLSSDAKSDLKFLMSIFPQFFVVHYENVLESDCTVFLFIDSKTSSIVTWATETPFPVNEPYTGGEVQHLDFYESSLKLCKITLPSGLIMLLCPSESSAVQSQRLARFVQKISDPSIENGDNDGQAQPLPKMVLPKFPTLNVQLLGSDGTYNPFPLNSPLPIPVETNLFRGKILIVLRPPNPESEDPYWNERIFSRQQRRTVVQVQGKFLRKPRGVVYAGAQISEPMKLGLITRGVCSVLLRLVESFKKDVHYSYGSTEESAHIVAPAHNFFERMSVTKLGEKPPCMEEAFPETKEAMAYRKSATSFDWNTTDTYSFSFFSMYIDLLTWKLVNIPATGDLHLKTFWGNSLLNICMYEKIGDGNRHLDQDNNYVFSVRAHHLGESPLLANGSGSRSDEASESESFALLPWPERIQEPSVTSIPDTSPLERTIPHSESQVFHPIDLSSISPIRYNDELIVEGEPELNFFDAEQGREDVVFSDPENANPFDVLRMIDSTAPFWIEQYKGNSTTTLFAVNRGTVTTFRKNNACEELVHRTMRMKLSRILKQFSPRLSNHERLRRSLGMVLSDPEAAALDTVKTFLEDEENTVECLQEGSIVQTKEVMLAGTVARALSDRHWVEEWAKLSMDKQSLLFHRNADRRRHHFQVKLSTVSKIEDIGKELSPIAPALSVLALTTIGRTLYLMFATKEESKLWATKLKELVKEAVTLHANGESSFESNVLRLFDIENIFSEFLHNSSMWKCKSRRILNCGKFHFREGNAMSVESGDALAVVSEALESTQASQAEGLEDAERRRGFLDSVAKLKAVSLHGIGEDARLVFYMNLYHVMTTHAFLILGPPDSSLKWFKYFNTIAYQVNDDVFSLSELEHCIIRSNMTAPSQLFSKFVIPKTKFKCALKSTNDFRINFGLNCGSQSIPSTVLCYNVDTIDEQLTQASRICLGIATTRLTNSGTLILYLPRVVQWFADDFGGDQHSRLASIRALLPDDIQADIANASRVEVKFQPFSFECRPVTLYTAPKASKNMSSSTT